MGIQKIYTDEQEILNAQKINEVEDLKQTVINQQLQIEQLTEQLGELLLGG